MALLRIDHQLKRTMITLTPTHEDHYKHEAKPKMHNTQKRPLQQLVSYKRKMKYM